MGTVSFLIGDGDCPPFAESAEQKGDCPPLQSRTEQKGTVPRAAPDLATCVPMNANLGVQTNAVKQARPFFSITRRGFYPGGASKQFCYDGCHAHGSAWA